MSFFSDAGTKNAVCEGYFIALYSTRAVKLTKVGLENLLEYGWPCRNHCSLVLAEEFFDTKTDGSLDGGTSCVKFS